MSSPLARKLAEALYEDGRVRLLTGEHTMEQRREEETLQGVREAQEPGGCSRCRELLGKLAKAQQREREAKEAVVAIASKQGLWREYALMERSARMVQHGDPAMRGWTWERLRELRRLLGIDDAAKEGDGRARWRASSPTRPRRRRAGGRGEVKVRPISLNAARSWINSVHRHLRRPVTGD